MIRIPNPSIIKKAGPPLVKVGKSAWKILKHPKTWEIAVAVISVVLSGKNKGGTGGGKSV